MIVRSCKKWSQYSSSSGIRSPISSGKYRTRHQVCEAVIMHFDMTLQLIYMTDLPDCFSDVRIGSLSLSGTGLFLESGPYGKDTILELRVCSLKRFCSWIICLSNCNVVTCNMPSRVSCIMSGGIPVITWKNRHSLRIEFLTTPLVTALYSSNGPFNSSQCLEWISTVRGSKLLSLNCWCETKLITLSYTSHLYLCLHFIVGCQTVSTFSKCRMELFKSA